MFERNVLGFLIILIFEAEPTVVIPDWYPLVHAVVPGLRALGSAFRGSAKQGGKLFLDPLPFHLSVVPGVDDEIPFLCSVLLIDVSILGNRRGT